MDIRILRYFLTIAEEGSITKAAKKLNMAQPPLSTQIMNLEDELGVILFIRGKKKIQLTEAGTFLKSRAEEMVSAFDSLERQMKDYKNGMVGKVTIGTIEAVAAHYLPLIFKDFNKKYPDIKFEIWSGGTNDVLNRLDKGIIDLAFIRPPFEESRYHSLLLMNDSWGVLIPKGHPLENENDNPLTPQILQGEQLIVPSTPGRLEEIKEWFSAAGIEPDIAYSYNTLAIAEGLVREKLGIALVLIGNSTDNLVLKKMYPKLSSSVHILWAKNHYLSDSSSRFIEYISSINHT